MQKPVKILFLVFFSVVLVTFFTRNNLRSVSDTAPEVLGEPVQSETDQNKLIKFSMDGYDYELSPLYDYEINGLIIGKMNYRRFSISRIDAAFPMDLGLIWGENVKSGIYRDRRVKFSTDGRWSRVKWYGDVNFNLNQMSNNHLLINDKALWKRVKALCVGDQVKIKGKLVNVKAILRGKGGRYEPEWLTWNTSVSRTDSGNGACEVIYCENLQVLKKGNSFSGFLFRASSWGLLLAFGWNAVLLFRKP